MASKREWEAMRTALGDRLFNDPRITEHLYVSHLEHGSWADFDAIWSEGWTQFSTSETQTIALAEVMYRGTSHRFDLGVFMACVDDETWYRAVEAITIKRGLHTGLSILPGEWIDSIGGIG